jgi:hypothetical protein
VGKGRWERLGREGVQAGKVHNMVTTFQRGMSRVIGNLNETLHNRNIFFRHML